jgi:NAD(P)-dependent dehydrogenase (short-subunit alcohol dehydrogenase family)
MNSEEGSSKADRMSETNIMNSSNRKIALVTGANRGIGLETCRQLSQMGILTVLSSRDEGKGRTALNSLKGQGGELIYHLLDVTDDGSIANIRSFIEQNFGRLDILVNNAGIFIDRGVSVFDLSMETLHRTLDTNFTGALKMCQAFVPMMRKKKYGRIVNVSSGMGSLKTMSGYSPAYRLSKTILNALTRIMADEVREDNILINTMAPGWVRTDMGGTSAPRSLAQGADTIVWLATLTDDGPTGGFFEDRKAIPW